MDFENLVISVFFIVLVTFAVGICASVIMDMSSVNECLVLGYDNGEQYFWQHRTVCWNVLEPEHPEEREYYVIER